ncbi:MAG: SixA phosphatase family protein [Elusimicrobiota bacterium]
MELLIVRHGPAGNAAEKDAWRRAGRPDSTRPLTNDGRRRTRAAAAGLARVVSDFGLVATSPYARAAQTAKLVAKALRADLVECAALIPGRPLEEALAWLRSRDEDKIALVGHEPHLSRFACFLMTGRDGAFLSLKKPQALLLELGAVVPGRARLIWSLPPRQLRALGGD